MTREEAIEIIKEVHFDINTKINGTTRFSQALEIAIEALEQEAKIDVLDKIRAEIEQLPTNTRINWDGCCPDPDYQEIEFVDVSKKALLSIIDKYKTDMEE